MAKKRGKKNRHRQAATRNELDRELAGAGALSVRNPWYGSGDVASTLTPERLAQIIQAVKQGEAQEFLTLAEDIEEADGHYRSVLGTRKLAISRLKPVVDPGGEDSRSLKIAEAVRKDVVERPEYRRMIFDALDGLGKGYSVVEVMWETTETRWRPVSYHWRDPRWFDYDVDTGRRLMLRTATGLQVLPAAKFIIHEPQLKSGLPLRSGLALVAAYLWLIKNSTLSGWVAFVLAYGFPLRMGKYPRNATKEDKKVLERAVRNIGRDIGCVIPEAMAIEFANAIAPGTPIELHERLVRWCDEQLSKTVVGQTSTADATPGKLGSDDTQEEVRLDIMEADAADFDATINRDLIRPYVDYNFGPQERYPYARLPVPRPEDVTALVKNVSMLVPLGLPVKRSEMYAKLGLTEPREGDLVIESSGTPVVPNRNGLLRLTANASIPQAGDELSEVVAGEDWEPLLRPLHDQIEELAQDAGSYDEIQRRLPELLARLDTADINRRLAIAQTLARGLGDRDFRSEE